MKVKAGLSPLDKANIQKDTAIGIAQALSNIQFPASMIIAGGGPNGGKMNPLDALGFRSLYDTSMKMSNEHPRVARPAKATAKAGDKSADSSDDDQ